MEAIRPLLFGLKIPQSIPADLDCPAGLIKITVPLVTYGSEAPDIHQAAQGFVRVFLVFIDTASDQTEVVVCLRIGGPGPHRDFRQFYGFRNFE